jgi:hypothetical protein
MEPRFEQFVHKRQFFSNVSAATLEWYKHSFKWLPTQLLHYELEDAVVRMREKAWSAILQAAEKWGQPIGEKGKTWSQRPPL